MIAAILPGFIDPDHLKHCLGVQSVGFICWYLYLQLEVDQSAFRLTNALQINFGTR